MADVDGVFGRIFCVRRNRQVEQRRQKRLCCEPVEAGEIGWRVDGADQVKIGLQRLGAALFNRRFIHEGLVDRTGFVDGRGGHIGNGGCVLLQNIAHAGLGQVPQDIECAVAGLVGRNDQVVNVCAVRVLKKIIAGRDTEVLPAAIKAERPRSGGWRGRRGSGRDGDDRGCDQAGRFAHGNPFVSTYRINGPYRFTQTERRGGEGGRAVPPAGSHSRRRHGG